MASILIGAAAAAVLWRVVDFARAKKLTIRWWQWLLTVLNVLYGVFVAEVILALVYEGSIKGAVVMGTLMGFAALVWAVLLTRFVFKPAPTEKIQPDGGSHD